MADKSTEVYVWSKINALAQEVAEQTEAIQELRAWEEFQDRWEAEREETLSVLYKDIERCRKATKEEEKRIAAATKRLQELGGTTGVVRWNQHARHAEERMVAVEVGQCWFPETYIIPSNTTTGMSVTPIPITTTAVDLRPIPRRNFSHTFPRRIWSASETDALVTAISKNTTHIHADRINWKGICSELAERGYARTMKACRTYWQTLQIPNPCIHESAPPPPPPPPPSIPSAVCLCGACDDRSYGTNAWKLVEGHKCKLCRRLPQHPTNYSQCSQCRDPTKGYGDGNHASERVQLEADIRQHLVASNTELDSQRYTHFTSTQNGVHNHRLPQQDPCPSTQMWSVSWFHKANRNP